MTYVKVCSGIKLNILPRSVQASTDSRQLLGLKTESINNTIEMNDFTWPAVVSKSIYWTNANNIQQKKPVMLIDA